MSGSVDSVVMKCNDVARQLIARGIIDGDFTRSDIRRMISREIDYLRGVLQNRLGYNLTPELIRDASDRVEEYAFLLSNLSQWWDQEREEENETRQTICSASEATRALL